jgi:ankyrin repeat protein
LDELDNAIASWSTDRELKDVLTDALVISCAYLCQEAAFHLLARPDIDSNSTSELVEGYEFFPPLVVAVMSCTGQYSLENTAIAERLIERGAKIDTTDLLGRTPLLHAVAQGNTALIQALLEKGASTNAGRHFSPLHLACANGAEAVVELLLSRDADAEAPTEEQMTPLHVAAAQGYCSIVESLSPHIGSRAMNASCIGGWSPLHLACAGDQTALIYSLARAGPWKLFPESKSTAAIVNRYRVVEILLSNYANVNQISDSSKTALHLAAVSGDVGIICLLLSQEYIYIDAKDDRGNTPLLDAVEAHQSREVIDLLVPWSHRALSSLPPRVKEVIQDCYASIIDFSPPQFDSHKSQQTIFDLLYASQGHIGKSRSLDPARKGVSGGSIFQPTTCRGAIP